MEIHGSRVVVTGGAGFIGSHLVDRLLARDNRVIVIDDLSSGHLRNLADHRRDPRLAVFQADVRDQERTREIISGSHFVFHLATRGVRAGLHQPTLVHDVNATGTLNVLKAAAAAGVRRLLYCSSSEVNGTADVVPMPEDYHYRPETIYGASKLTGEYYSRVFHRAGWLQTVVARPHNNYGPREHYRGVLGEVIPRFILRALAGEPLWIFGDGTQTRDFTYVEETADLLIRLLECDGALGDTFNVCRGEEVSIAQIAALVKKLTGSDSLIEYHPGRPGDVLRLYGDPGRLHRTLGTAPAVSIEEGLARTTAWFRDNVPINNDVLRSLVRENWRSLPMEPWLSRVSQRQAVHDRAA